MLTKRYTKQFDELNKNVYLSAVDDNGYFEAPVVSIAPGGASQFVTGEPRLDEFNKRAKPAKVEVELKKLKSVKTYYGLKIPYQELEIAAQNEAYFNYLMDSVLSKAVSNYVATWGSTDVVRFGSKYISFGRGFYDGDDFALTLELEGHFATQEEA